jgi:hypothetical protein
MQNCPSRALLKGDGYFMRNVKSPVCVLVTRFEAKYTHFILTVFGIHGQKEE